MDIAEKPIEAVIAVRLIGQEIGARIRAAAAQGTILGAMDGDTEVIGYGSLACRLIFRRLRQCERLSHRLIFLGAGAEESRYIIGLRLELDIGNAEPTDIAAGPGEGHPRGGSRLAAFAEHLRFLIAAECGPVE